MHHQFFPFRQHHAKPWRLSRPFSPAKPIWLPARQRYFFPSLNTKNSPLATQSTPVLFNLPAPATASASASHSACLGWDERRGLSLGCRRLTLSERREGEVQRAKRCAGREGMGRVAEGESGVGVGYLPRRAGRRERGASVMPEEGKHDGEVGRT